MARVVVDVMPKPEILDPQGKAVTGSLRRLGHEGLTVRQGKRFEIEVDGEIDEARIEQVTIIAETLLANTVIETYDVYVELDEDELDDVDGCCGGDCGCTHGDEDAAESGCCGGECDCAHDEQQGA